MSRRAIWSFNGRVWSDEHGLPDVYLTLEEGDFVKEYHMNATIAQGWLFGANLRTRTSGWFPPRCAVEVSSEDYKMWLKEKDKARVRAHFAKVGVVDLVDVRLEEAKVHIQPQVAK